ncbi:methyltransferase-like protein 13 [Histomonas meleagridis]|uniref:methyltransferase-like protein 13 n=1 Tax=Histomonas meleagridis TaxID=135588 RepID=UPI00355ACD8D|nr:methyltransferase-like protein 13 [Histomonas meleagridis]KAH0800388.1 methyltransferase-like protein 13 [Histomonas meleagridis]
MSDTEYYTAEYYTTENESTATIEKDGETHEELGQNDDEDKKENEEKNEEEEKKEPPEPEQDPLEGITYEDDPDAELPQYGEQSYWDERYTNDSECFEWYQEPEALLPICQEFIDPEKNVLVIGTGTSELTPYLSQNGFENITAIDYSKIAIKKMKKRNQEIENITWKVMDIRKMSFFPNSDFQSVIDKGTLDCLFHVSESDVFSALSEISRVLKRRGVYICVSYAPPEERKEFFERPADLNLELEKVIELKKPVPSDEPHYVYIVRKCGKLLT